MQISPVLSTGHPSCQRWTTPTGPDLIFPFKKKRERNISQTCWSEFSLSVCVLIVCLHVSEGEEAIRHPPPKKKVSASVGADSTWTLLDGLFTYQTPSRLLSRTHVQHRQRKRRGHFLRGGKKKYIYIQTNQTRK